MKLYPKKNKKIANRLLYENFQIVDKNTNWAFSEQIKPYQYEHYLQTLSTILDKKLAGYLCLIGYVNMRKTSFVHTSDSMVLCGV